MYGLSRGELRFAFVIGSAHFTQHVYYRIVPPLIPVLAVALTYPLWQLGLLISLYSFGMGLAQAPFGVISDRVDRRYLLPTGLAITGAAYIVFSLAPTLGGPIPSVTLLGYAFAGSYLVMAFAMVLVGLGLAVVHPVGYPMISDNVSPDNKGKVLGIFGSSSKLGDAATPAAIAVLILVLAWHEIIGLIGAAGILYGGVLYWVLRSDEFETVPSGQRGGTGDDRSGGLLSGARASYLYPMVTMYFFFVFSFLTSQAILTFLPTFIVDVYAFSLDVSGIHFGPESVANVYFALVLIAGAVMQLVLGALTDTHDSRLVLLGCMALATGGMVALAVFELHAVVLLVVVVLLGTGLFGLNPARDALISDISPGEHEGRSFGYIWTAATLTGAAFPAIIGFILELVGMRTGFLVLASGAVLAGACIGALYSPRIYAEESDIAPTVDVSD